MNTIKMSKNALRKEMKQKLSLLTIEEKQFQSEAISKKLLALPEYQDSKNVSIFLNMIDEIQTTSILQNAFMSHKNVFIPRYVSSSNFMDMVRLYSWKEFESLPLTKWKIKQPPIDEERQTAMSSGGLDLILIPGLAFTSKGHRLGRGRGYYDTYLRRCYDHQDTPPVTVALAFAQQLLSDLPIEDTDVPINIVLTG